MASKMSNEEEDFQEPNLGFQAILSKWQKQDKVNANNPASVVNITTGAASSSSNKGIASSSSSSAKEGTATGKDTRLIDDDVTEDAAVIATVTTRRGGSGGQKEIVVPVLAKRTREEAKQEYIRKKSVLMSMTDSSGYDGLGLPTSPRRGKKGGIGVASAAATAKATAAATTAPSAPAPADAAAVADTSDCGCPSKAATGVGAASPRTPRKGNALRAQYHNVYQKPLPLEEVKKKRHKSSKDELEKILILKALKKNFVFSDLSEKALMPLVESFEPVKFKKDDVIIKQGDPGDYFYIIMMGMVIFQVNGQTVGRAKSGASFGELSLLYTCPRAATVVAAERSKLFRVDQNSFRYILQSQTQESEANKYALLKNVAFLKDLSEFDMKKLGAVMTPRVFRKDELIVKKGEVGDAFYIIQEGTVLVKDISVGSTTYEDQTLGPGEYFGERSLATSEPRAANVVGTTNGVAFSIDRETFEKVLGRMSDLVVRSQDVRRLAGVSVLKRAALDFQQYAALASNMEDKVFSAGEAIVVKGGQTDAALYFVRKGKVELSEDGQITSIIQEGGFFGEEIFCGKLRVKAKFTAKAVEKCECGVLTVDSSSGIFDTKCLGADSGDEGMMDSLSELHVEIKSDAKLEDLEKHSILGEGTFGQVWLVSEKLPDGGRRPYALKIQSKFDLAEEGQIKAVVQEKNIMSKMHHPFIIKLVNTFQDKDFVYILLEMVQGGELFSVLHDPIHEENGLPEDQAKFYGLCVADALAYMHRSKYVYRDLKPENVMIDSKGYPVLIDFGFAKYVSDKTYTLCGTPGYLPPEVVMTRGHNGSADNWSLGILVYEMVSGMNPFFFDGMDQMSLFQAIVQDDYDDPTCVTPEVVDLIRKLLVKEPTLRLGSLAKGERDILEHPWFDGLDLRAIHRRKAEAPWVPEIQDCLDVSNFDDWSHLEDRTALIYEPISQKDAVLFEGF